MDEHGAQSVLRPRAGYTLELEHDADRLVITVLDQTRVIDGVTTRVVEERETHQGQPVEVSRNYCAMSTRTNAVFYFGEDVDEYKAGKISGHGGSWIAGVDGAHFGLMMPGQPLVGAKYYQEIAPRLAMDRAEVVSTTNRLQTPAGTFSDVLKTAETSELEPGPGEAKYYAAGVGLLRDGDLLLVRYGPKR